MELYPSAYHLNFDRHAQHDEYNDPLFNPQQAQPTSNTNPSTDDQPIDDEPLYVNAKQYFRILKRRVARARLEEVHRLSRQRKVFLHVSFLFLNNSCNLPSHIFMSLAINTLCDVLEDLEVASSLQTK